MPQDESIQGRHLKVYTFHTFLSQLTLAIITFYCVIAISNYDPTSVSAVPRLVTPQTPSIVANSTTQHVCKAGERDDFPATLIAITPYIVLCPTTPIFFLSLLTFFLSIFTFNSLHTEDIDLVDGYAFFTIMGVVSIDWDNALVSFQTIMPMVIWAATLLLPIGHCLFKSICPEIYWAYRRELRLQREEIWKAIDCRGEVVRDIEAGREAVVRGGVEEIIDEETPLRRDQRREERRTTLRG